MSPRFSAPASFTSRKQYMSFTKLYLFALLLIGLTGFDVVHAQDSYFSDDNGRNCVCDPDDSIDYFPVKIDVEHATGFSVEYENTYKIITVGEHEIYAYLCGTTKPTIPEGALAVEIPLKNVALGTSTIIPFLEYIKQRESIDIISVPETSIYGVCMKERVASGKAVAPGYSLDANLHKKDVHVVFSNFVDYTLDAIKKLNLDTDPVVLPTAAYLEKTALGTSEWVEYFSLFFNREEAAMNIIDNIEKRYNCFKEQVADLDPEERTVLWAYPSNGVWSVAHCPNYYCDYISDLGSSFVDFGEINDEPVKTVSHSDMLNMVNSTDIDVFFLSAEYGTNWYLPDVNDTALVDEVREALGPEVPMYDFSKSPNAWFQMRPAEPDIALQDIATVLYPELQFEHERIFLRNPIDPEDEKIILTGECPDPKAPLFNNWKQSGCAGEVVTIPGLTDPTEKCYDDFRTTSKSVIAGAISNGISTLLVFTLAFAQVLM